MPRLIPALLLLSLPLWPQAKKSVFVITDAEGIAGVCRQDLTEPHDQELRQLLAGEVDAQADGRVISESG